MRKGESGTNNLLDQQISANLQRLLVWHSGDYDGLQSQRSRVQIQVSAKKTKKTGGLDQWLGLELGGSMGLGIGMDGIRCFFYLYFLEFMAAINFPCSNSS